MHIEKMTHRYHAPQHSPSPFSSLSRSLPSSSSWWVIFLLHLSDPPALTINHTRSLYPIWIRYLFSNSVVVFHSSDHVEMSVSNSIILVYDYVCYLFMYLFMLVGVAYQSSDFFGWWIWGISGNVEFLCYVVECLQFLWWICVSSEMLLWLIVCAQLPDA